MTPSFRPFFAPDALAISLQLSQLVTAGMVAEPMTLKEAQDLEDSGPAWTAIAADGRLLCCAGIYVTFRHPETEEPVQGHAWAMLADGIGAYHLELTRFARCQILESPIRRIESNVRADCKSETSWARLCGMAPVARLEAWGARSEPHMLFERVRP